MKRVDSQLWRFPSEFSIAPYLRPWRCARARRPSPDRPAREFYGKWSFDRAAYSARCDGSTEASSPGKIRCRDVDRNAIDGEQLDNNDKVHRYYRRTVSEDGRMLTIAWFSDARRTKLIERFVYRKD
jgi:hypothetical protein